jgi:hypothetical protein
VEEPDGLAVILNEVFQQEEFDVPGEIPEQGEEFRIPEQDICEGARLAKIVAADALQGSSKRSAILGWSPRAPLIVGFPPILLPGNKSVLPAV